MASSDDSAEKSKPCNNEGGSFNNDYEGRNPWNTREKKKSWWAYIIVASACLLLAYALSGTAK